MLDPKPGACRSHVVNRWYYDKYLQDCATFPYTGCHGNKNNFESKEQCQQICASKNHSRDNFHIHFISSHTMRGNIIALVAKSTAGGQVIRNKI